MHKILNKPIDNVRGADIPRLGPKHLRMMESYIRANLLEP